MAPGALGALVELVGLRGVSVAALVLVSLALYAHKAGKAGSVAATAAGRTIWELKVFAVLLALLVGVGILHVDQQRTVELWELLRTEGPAFLDWLADLAGGVVG